MGMFSPADISRRITMFIEGKIEFPFIKKEELIGAFFIFGKSNGIYGEDEILAATDLSKRTVMHLIRTVRVFITRLTKWIPISQRRITPKESWKFP